jgi:hypothetical protein
MDTPYTHAGLLIVEIDLASIWLNDKSVWSAAPRQTKLCAIAMDAPLGANPQSITSPTRFYEKNYPPEGRFGISNALGLPHECGAILKISTNPKPSNRLASIASDASQASGSPALCLQAVLSCAISGRHDAAFNDDEALRFCLDAYAMVAESAIFDGAKAQIDQDKPLACMLDLSAPFGESFRPRLEKLALFSHTKHTDYRTKMRI